MKQMTTYLNFDGNCREAMQFYQKCLRTELQLTPVTDTQGKPSGVPTARIMHSQLVRNGQTVLQASDTQPGVSMHQGNNFHVSVDCDSTEEIDRLFAALSETGRVTVPLGNMPWGARFGMLTDKYGIQWILNCALSR